MIKYLFLTAMLFLGSPAQGVCPGQPKRCKAIDKSGRKCQMRVERNSDYCSRHENPSTRLRCKYMVNDSTRCRKEAQASGFCPKHDPNGGSYYE